MYIVERVFDKTVLLECDDLRHLTVQKSAFISPVQEGDLVVKTAQGYDLDQEATAIRRAMLTQKTHRLFQEENR